MTKKTKFCPSATLLLFLIAVLKLLLPRVLHFPSCRRPWSLKWQLTLLVNCYRLNCYWICNCSRSFTVCRTLLFFTFLFAEKPEGTWFDWRTDKQTNRSLQMDKRINQWDGNDKLAIICLYAFSNMSMCLQLYVYMLVTSKTVIFAVVTLYLDWNLRWL